MEARTLNVSEDANGNFHSGSMCTSIYYFFHFLEWGEFHFPIFISKYIYACFRSTLPLWKYKWNAGWVDFGLTLVMVIESSFCSLRPVIHNMLKFFH